MIFSERIGSSRKSLGMESLRSASVPRDGEGGGCTQPVLSAGDRCCHSQHLARLT